MTDRPNDLRNIAKALRDAAGAGPALHRDALREYARRIDEGVDAHFAMRGGIASLVAGLVAGLVVSVVTFVSFRGVGGLLLGVMLLVSIAVFAAFAKLRAATHLRNIAKGLRSAGDAGPALHRDALREYARRIDEWADESGPLSKDGISIRQKVVVVGIMVPVIVLFTELGRGWGWWGTLLGVMVVVVLILVLVVVARRRGQPLRLWLYP